MHIQQLYQRYLQHPTVCTDTRKIASGSIFFALKGERFDANSFAATALELGAALVIVDNPKVIAKNDERYILVKDVLSCLQQLASYHRRQLSIPVIGLTGTNGKTTTKELMNAVLSQKYLTYATQGNLNNHIGVPLTLLAIHPQVQVAIIEMGANHQKEIEFLCEIARPDMGLITNVGKAHLEGFGGFEGVKKGKGELYTYLQQHKKTVFINSDNHHLMEMANNYDFSEVIYYGNQGKVNGRLKANNPFLEVEWCYENRTYTTTSQLTGIYNFENILAAIACGLKLNLLPEQINAGIKQYRPSNNRSQIIKTERNTVIGDFYNANPSSMAVAIENLTALEAPSKTLILGDMFELGAESPVEHQTVLSKISRSAVNHVFLVGEQFKAFSLDFSDFLFFENTAKLKSFIKANPLNNQLILLKGSRGMKLETILEDL